MSLVTIASHHHEYRSHNLLTLHHSKVVDRQLPTSTHYEIHGKHGTRVTVRNLFGNLPVRVKQRGIAAEQKTEHDRLWEILKRESTSLVLSWCEPVFLKIRDADGKAFINLSTVAQGGNETSTRSSRRRSMLHVLTQAGYIFHDEWASWIPVSASTSTVSVKGAISLEPAPSKRIQFISLGIIPLSSDSGNNELFDEINRIFALSSFGTVDANVDDEKDEKIRRKNEISNYSHRQLKARKGVDRYAKFHLRLSTKHDSDLAGAESFFTEDGSNLNTMIEVLKAVVTEWLAFHHFQPRKASTKGFCQPLSAPTTAEPCSNDAALSDSNTPTIHRMSGDSAVSTLARSKSGELNNHKRKRPKAQLTGKEPDRKHHLVFSDWSRIKSGNTSFLANLGRKVTKRPSTEETSTVQNVANPHSFRVDVAPIQVGSLHQDVQPSAPPTQDLFSDKDRYDEAIPWMDPTTKRTYLLNARTGCVLPRLPTRPRTHSSSIIRGSTLEDFNKPLRLPLKPNTSNPESKTWLKGILRDWKNPIFPPAEASIQQASLHEEHQGRSCNQSSYSVHEQNQNNGSSSALSTYSSGKLSRTGLANAEVLAQLDKKFILVKMKLCTGVALGLDQGVDGHVLCLIDQHAADERIRVEKLFAELCTPLPSGTRNYRSGLGHQSEVAFRVLEKPIQLVLSAQEEDQFAKHATRFAAWGILFDIASRKTVPNKTQLVLSVTSLPPIISERCKSDPQVLITFLRTAVWKYAEASSINPSEEPPQTSGDKASWVRRISDCPEGLVDLVNSRACRSAIMFNDELSLEQCRELVHKLCKCVFPFICAHGRPSMVPLVNIGIVGAPDMAGFDVNTSGNEVPDDGFTAAWKRWQKK